MFFFTSGYGLMQGYQRAREQGKGPFAGFVRRRLWDGYSLLPLIRTCLVGNNAGIRLGANAGYLSRGIVSLPQSLVDNLAYDCDDYRPAPTSLGADDSSRLCGHSLLALIFLRLSGYNAWLDGLYAELRTTEGKSLQQLHPISGRIVSGLMFLSMISFELYLLHGVWINALRGSIICLGSNALYVALVFACSILSSWLIHSLLKRIYWSVAGARWG